MTVYPGKICRRCARRGPYDHHSGLCAPCYKQCLLTNNLTFWQQPGHDECDCALALGEHRKPTKYQVIKAADLAADHNNQAFDKELAAMIRGDLTQFPEPETQPNHTGD